MSDVPAFVPHLIKMYWSPGQKILEVGCGPAFLRPIFGKDYIGTDITEAPYTATHPRDVDIVCSAEALLVADASVDIVLIKSALYLFPDLGGALHEAWRVLKPGGTLMIFDYNRRTQAVLQHKEGHTRYPCWSQWGLKKCVQQHGFQNVQNFIAENVQPTGLKRYYHLIRQELRGNWAIVFGTKA